jgi:hypothetical protein
MGVDHSSPSQAFAWTWTSRRRLVRVLCALVAVAGVSAAGWVWLESTRPADPLVLPQGLGFEGSGRTGVRVGQPIAFVAWLLTKAPVTVTGYQATQPGGMTVRVVAITGPPPYRQALSIVTRPPGQPGMAVVRSRIVPAVGRRSAEAPPGIRTHLIRYLLPVAIIATARHPGCHRLGRVTIAYRVGGTTFHRSTLPAAGFISTTKRACFGVATANTGVYRSP